VHYQHIVVVVFMVTIVFNGYADGGERMGSAKNRLVMYFGCLDS